MERFIPSREAIFDERAKHSVLLVGAVEESANVTLPAEIAPGKLHGLSLGSHISPQFQSVADLHTEVQRRSAESRGREVGDEEIRCGIDRKSTRLNSSHTVISYAVFCLKKKRER